MYKSLYCEITFHQRRKDDAQLGSSIIILIGKLEHNFKNKIWISKIIQIWRDAAIAFSSI